ncbi:MAG: PQQ-binding-like beta-propeller repeat protein [Fimbriiglobus sp.]
MKTWFLLTGFFLTSTSLWAENWPQWRGPNNDGVSTEKNLPAEWGAEKNIVLKIPMPGPGASTPCIWGDRIFLTAQVEKALVLFCVTKSGEKKWERTLGIGEGKYRDDEGNMASASCSTDGKRVYAFAGTGKLGAYDFDGNPVWEHDLPQKYGQFKIQFGGHWTPVLYKDRLYVTLMHRGMQAVVAFKTDSGEVAWKVDRKSDGTGESPDVYSSPFIWQNGDKAMLIVHGNDYCTGHKLEDGEEVWRVNELNPKANYNRAWRSVSSPLVTPNLIVVPSCKQHPTAAINPLTAKGLISPGSESEIWRFPSTPDVSSPLLVGNIVYLMGSTGQLDVVNAKTGKAFYRERVTNERHRANPLLADGKVYLLGREGNCPVLKADSESYEPIAKNKLPDTFTASPATSDGQLYLRGWKHLWVIGKK